MRVLVEVEVLVGEAEEAEMEDLLAGEFGTTTKKCLRFWESLPEDMVGCSIECRKPGLEHRWQKDNI